MIYSTIRPKFCKVIEVKFLADEFVNVIPAVEAEGVEATHAMVSENGAVYAYGTEKELKQMMTLLGAIIGEISV